jgi:COMPASS component SWD3
MSVRFSPNGKYVLAWTLDSAVRLWNYVDGRCVKTYQGHTNKSYGICGSFGTYYKYNRAYDDAPAAMIVSGSEDGIIWLWDVGNKGVLQKIEGAHKGVIFGTDTHPNSNLIVSGGEDCLVNIWQLKDEQSAPHDAMSGAIADEDISTLLEVAQNSETPADLMEIDDHIEVKREQT